MSLQSRLQKLHYQHLICLCRRYFKQNAAKELIKTKSLINFIVDHRERIMSSRKFWRDLAAMEAEQNLMAKRRHAFNQFAIDLQKRLQYKQCLHLVLQHEHESTTTEHRVVATIVDCLVNPSVAAEVPCKCLQDSGDISVPSEYRLEGSITIQVQAIDNLSDLDYSALAVEPIRLQLYYHSTHSIYFYQAQVKSGYTFLLDVPVEVVEILE